ncbi:hypothetical protein [Leptolyngbya sp. PCC 6406]|uniref:hypothetical protein n=1 Tax=Leptolyngbya sp. PCC 6406 TaxID=1173264 RepID=UPI0002ACBFC0|nr:hypothetical protein [Leptolyngbya sp. PCC 6406]
MKRYLLSGLVLVMSTLAMASTANASQTHFNDPAADLNGDGEVTLMELQEYNRAQRQA